MKAIWRLQSMLFLMLLVVSSVSSSPVAAGGSDIPLRVTVQNTDKAGFSTNIQNDGLGVYIDGVDKVGAYINPRSGVLVFNTYSAPNPPYPTPRWVNMIYEPISPSTFIPPSSFGRRFWWNTEGQIRVNDLGVGGNPAAACYRVIAATYVDDSKTNYQFHFKRYPYDGTSPTSFVKITRTSISPDEWIAESNSDCGTIADTAGLKINSTKTDDFYRMPFFMIFRQK